MMVVTFQGGDGVRKLLVVLVILAGALCFYVTRPSTIHEKVSEEPAVTVVSSSVPTGLPGTVRSLPQPLQLAYQAWNIRTVARQRIPRADWVPLNAISPWLPKAQVAVEDKRFYSHHGVDPDGIIRATLINIQNDEVVEGGSTITQQLVKNLLLTSDQTLGRKAAEMGLAFIVEARCSKAEILEMYLNTTFLGAGATGVKQASDVYFGKKPKDLSLSQAAMLAGLPYAPTALNPYNNWRGAKKRRNLVLQRMYEQHMISDTQLEEATSEPLKIGH